MAEEARSKIKEILSVITIHDLEKAMSRPVDELIAVIQAKLSNYNPLLVKATLRSYWKDIEEYLTSAPKLLKIIEEERPDLAERIKRKPRWFNELLRKLYKFLYDTAWR